MSLTHTCQWIGLFFCCSLLIACTDSQTPTDDVAITIHSNGKIERGDEEQATPKEVTEDTAQQLKQSKEFTEEHIAFYVNQLPFLDERLSPSIFLEKGDSGLCVMKVDSQSNDDYAINIPRNNTIIFETTNHSSTGIDIQTVVQYQLLDTMPLIVLGSFDEVTSYKKVEEKVTQNYFPYDEYIQQWIIWKYENGAWQPITQSSFPKDFVMKVKEYFPNVELMEGKEGRWVLHFFPDQRLKDIHEFYFGEKSLGFDVVVGENGQLIFQSAVDYQLVLDWEKNNYLIKQKPTYILE